MKYGKSTGNPIRGGAFGADNLKGYKTLSKQHMPAAQGKMSSAHGTDSGNPNKGMINAGGRIGQGRGFSSGNFKQGPCPISGNKANRYKK